MEDDQMRLKKIIFGFLCIIFLANICFAQEPQGYVEIKDGKKIVRVYGTHYERGYTHGYLLCNEIIEIFSDYFLAYIFGNNAYSYTAVRTTFEQRFEIDTIFITESQGILAGIVAAGNTLYNTVLGRNIDETDILLCNSIVEFTDKRMQFSRDDLCSSIASWGTSTENFPELLSESIITRFLDWTPHQTLMNNHIILVSTPSESNEQPWISFTFPALIGCLSSINEEGIGSFYNVGNIDTYNPADTFNPIFLSIRKGIEVLDYNSSGECNPADVVSAVCDDVQKTGSIMNVISSTEKDSFSLVIECNNSNGVAVRSKEDNTVIAGDNLVATNHFRKLYTPAYCYRYDKIADSLDVSTSINPARSWILLSGAAGTYMNLQAIQYIPWSGKILWSTKVDNSPAYMESWTSFTTNELFDYVSVDAPAQDFNPFRTLNIFPIPAREVVQVTFSAPQPFMGIVSMYDVKGRVVYWKKITADSGENTVSIVVNEEMNSGVYFIKLNAYSTSEIRKIIVVR